MDNLSRFLKFGRGWSLATVILIAISPNLLGQTSQITGLASDPSGASVPNSTVTVTNQDTGVTVKTQANAEGYYLVGGLVPGTYAVSIGGPGFKTVERKGIKLDVAQVARVDLTLEIGQTSERITVTSVAPLLQTENASVAQVVDHQTIMELPLNGRQFTQLAGLTPGAVSSGTGGFGGPVVVVNGGRASQTGYMIDGVATTEGWQAGTTIAPPPDAIQEFKVQSNALTAQYGQQQSVISIALRSGTSGFHGGVFEFLRNDRLDSRNFFAKAKGPLRFNQFGGLLGGPVIKNKTFFFLDYQGTRSRRAGTSNSVVATAAERQGDFSAQSQPLKDPLNNDQPFPGNIIPAARLSPQSTYFLKFFPLANSGLRNFIYTASNRSDADTFDLRMDHHFGSNDSLVYSQSFSNRRTWTNGSFPDNGGVDVTVQSQRFGLTENHIFGPNMLNELTLGWMRDMYNSAQQGLGTNYAGLAGIGGLQQTSSEYPGFSGLSISGMTGLNANAFQPTVRHMNKYQIFDNLSIMRGAHTLKAGLDIRSTGVFVTNGATSRGNFIFNGTYTGSAYPDFLLGIPYQGQRTFPRNLFGEYMRQQQFYFQDDWKVTPRLTFNLGLRYDLNHPARVLHDTYASTDVSLDKIIVASDSKGNISTGAQQVTSIVLPLFASRIIPSSQAGLPPTLRHIDLNNFAPRAGMAWQPGGGFVVRAGYGIFYILEEGNQTVSTGVVNPPFIVDELSTFNSTPLRNLATFFVPVSSQGFGLGPVGFFQLDFNRPNPYVQQWNFTVQKNVFQRVAVEASYVGSESVKLAFAQPMNIPLPGPGAIQGRRQNTFFSAGSLVDNSATASYNALQMKAEIRDWRGFSLLTAYTFAKSLDLISWDVQVASVQNPLNVRAERARGDLDMRQRFTTSMIYRLPALTALPKLARAAFGGWGISNVFTAATGLPITPSIGTDPANTGTSMRPDRIGSGTIASPGIDRWFDVSAFRVPQIYTFGNSGRNILSAPGLVNWDCGVLKDFPIPSLEGKKIEFRAEFFNLTNTAHFGGPVTNIQSSAAGQILSAGEPRDIQLGLKFRF